MTATDDRHPWLRDHTPGTCWNADTDMYQRQCGEADERSGRATFDVPTQRNEASGVELVEQQERDDLVEDRALAELGQMSERGRAGMAAQGRHVSDRLAGEQQWRRDQAETGVAVGDAGRGSFARHQATERALHTREAMRRPRGDDFVGVNQLSEAGYRRWVEHCAAGWGGPPHLLLDPDDLDMDAARDNGWGIDPDDLHYRSPDLDDFDDDGI